MIDTSVLSQTGKSRPDEAIMHWWVRQRPTELMLSAVVIHELRYGIELMKPGLKRDQLDTWLEQQVLRSFKERILAVNAAVADLSGRLLARTKHAGHTAEVNDTLIAAIATVYGLRVATLNRKHFDWLDVELVDF